MEQVTEKKVLTDEEMKSLYEINSKVQDVIQELGEIELHKLRLEERKNNAKSTLESIKKEEEEILKQINTKYGDVKINLETGEIINVS